MKTSRFGWGRVAVMAGLLIAGGAARGASYSWTGNDNVNNSGNWSDGANWGGTAPGGSDTGTLVSVSSGTRTVTVDVATSVFRSSTSAEAYGSFMASLPQTYVHDEVSLLGGARTAGAPRQAPAAPERSTAVEDELLALATAPRPRTGPVTHDGPRVGRNDPCPCGSGKKHKKCCGA